MHITKNLLTNKAARPGAKLTAVRGCVIHYVGNPGSTAIANRNYFNSGVSASSHYIIGLQGEIIQCVPEDEVTYHAGRAYGSAWTAMAATNNRTTISIECCHPDASGKFNAATYKSLVELTADICNRHGLAPATQVYRHYDVAGKSCPLWYVNNPGDWYKLKNDVIDLLRVQRKEEDEVVDKMALLYHGQPVEVERILKDGHNYVKLRDFEKLGLKVDYDTEQNLPTVAERVEVINVEVNGKVCPAERFLINGHNYLKLRDMGDMGFDVGFENGMSTLNNK